MLNYREQYLQINNIPGKEKRIKAAKFLIKNPQSKTWTKHKYEKLIIFFQKLIKEEIELEDFFTLGDGINKTAFITHDHGIEDGLKLIEDESNIKPESLVIIHQEASKHAKKVAFQKREKTVKTLKQKKCLLLEIENI